jgi:membrane protein
MARAQATWRFDRQSAQRAGRALKERSKELYQRAKRDELTTLAAAVAYFTAFAIPPLIILTVIIAAVLDRATSIPVVERLRTMIADHAPASTQQLLNDLVDRAIVKAGGGALSFGLIVTALIALWSGSNAVASMMRSFNRAYDVTESRSMLQQKLTSFGLTLVVAVGVNLAFILLVFGRRIGQAVADRAGLGSYFDLVWNILRVPVAIAAILGLLAVLFHFGPDVEQPFRWISPGTILSAILWLIATLGFGLYLSIANPGSGYGALGSVIVLLFYLYISAITFLLGVELDAILQETRDEGAGASAEQ